MKITKRAAADRGHGDHGWLKSAHSFSFADYYDPAHMGFRSLRVINDDYVAPGAGFPTHPHRDMEIFSYVLAGTIAHEDSLGNGRHLKPGQVQVMSAGRGVRHSEFNPSGSETLHLNQIWIQPRERGIEPRYSEWNPPAEREDARKILVISGDGRDGSAVIAQDADVYRVRLAKGESVTHELPAGRGAWVQVMRGNVELNGTALSSGTAPARRTRGSSPSPPTRTRRLCSSISRDRNPRFSPSL